MMSPAAQIRLANVWYKQNVDYIANNMNISENSKMNLLHQENENLENALHDIKSKVLRDAESRRSHNDMEELNSLLKTLSING